MKRSVSILLSVLLLLTCVHVGSPEAQAATKVDEPRTIAIVFDNSNSMYTYKKQRPMVEWCRATYAMEVFASMLNQNDTLLIYPMHDIRIGKDGKEVYTKENPLKITGPGQSGTVRKIYTDYPGETPIDTIDYAIEGLRAQPGAKKYLIVLTDGETFNTGDTFDTAMSKEDTKLALEQRFQENANAEMTIMYLGVGEKACSPDVNSQYFVKKMASDSKMVLSSLTDLCNRIFGRDTLPPANKTDTALNFDISMNKLIVFVQGENISDLKVINNETKQPVGKLVGTQQTKYSTEGNGRTDYTGGNTPDTSLQGMMVTYEDCAAGKCTISYSGSATSVEAYYEPNVDMVFEFTDAFGQKVDLNALYEGEYTVKYGMKDGKTGKWIESNLLGEPEFKVTYYHNDKTEVENSKGLTGQNKVTLKVGDKFKADMTVTYLSGYTIHKTSADFGWPELGIEIQPKPAGDLRIEITGGNADGIYPLQTLTDGKEYTLKMFFKDKQLTGAELEKAELTWDKDQGSANIVATLEGDHYKLKLEHKDPANPQGTACGECTVFFYATYQEEAAEPSSGQGSFTYTITEDRSVLEMSMDAPEDYIVISDLPDSEEIVLTFSINGQPLTAEQFEKLAVKVDCGGIQHTVTPCPEDSAYKIKLQETDGIEEDDYVVKVSAEYTDLIGRVTKVGDETEITLSAMPLWLKWAIFLLILIILIIIILIVMHIKVLPKYAHITKKGSTMNYDGEDCTKDTQFDAKIEKGRTLIRTRYAGAWAGVTMDAKPGKESYLKKRQEQRTAEVSSASVKKFGAATITDVSIGNVKYVLNEETGKLERTQRSDRPIELRHNMPIRYSGTMLRNGVQTPFNVSTKLNFKKKK